MENKELIKKIRKHYRSFFGLEDIGSKYLASGDKTMIEWGASLVETFCKGADLIEQAYPSELKEMDEKNIELVAKRIIECQVGCYVNSENGVERGEVDWEALEKDWITYLKASLFQSKQEQAKTVSDAIFGLFDACNTVVRGYQDDGMEHMDARDEVFYRHCNEAVLKYLDTVQSSQPR